MRLPGEPHGADSRGGGGEEAAVQHEERDGKTTRAVGMVDHGATGGVARQ